MKPLRTLLILALLLAPAFAQRPAVLQPVRVALKWPDNEVNADFAAALRNELRSIRGVAIAERRADYEIQFSATAFVGQCQGYVVAVLVHERESGERGLKAYAGPTIEALAAYVAATVNKEDFSPWQGKEAKQ